MIKCNNCKYLEKTTEINYCNNEESEYYGLEQEEIEYATYEECQDKEGDTM